MRKFLISASLLATISQAAITNDTYFIKANIGQEKMHKTKIEAGIAFGYYFYDPNKYNIYNRIYAEANHVFTDDTFNIFNLNLDWIIKREDISPYFGMNLGYLNFEANNQNFDAGSYGFNAGVIIPINYNMDFEVGFKWIKAFEKQDIWTTAIKKWDIGISYSF